MINTSLFNEKNTITPKQNPNAGDDYWIMGVDLGFGGVKGYSQNCVFNYPNYARIINFDNYIGTPPDNHFFYREPNGTIWAIGENAQSLISTAEAGDSMEVICGRNRYYNKMFRALSEMALGIGLSTNQFGSPNGKTIVFQTGLPPKYIKEDAKLLRDALSGHHEFDIKIGAQNWRHFDFELLPENIRIIAQPMGSYYSAIFDKDGHVCADGRDIYNGNVQVWDGGFKTFDTYTIKNRSAQDIGNSYDDLGMKRILEKTSEDIFKKYGCDYAVFELQPLLSEGYFTNITYVKDEDGRRHSKAEDISFADILEKNARSVCMDMLEKQNETTGGYKGLSHIILGGGTCAAWKNIITEEFAGRKIKIILSNRNDTSLPTLYSNARGYYFYLLKKLRQVCKG